MKWYDYIAPGHPFINSTVGGALSWLLILALIVWVIEYDWVGAARARTKCSECGRAKHYCQFAESCNRQ